MAAWCLDHNALLWRELGNSRALGYASALGVDRLRADSEFQAALAEAETTPPSYAHVMKVLHAIGPLCCFLSMKSPEFMTEIIHEARRLAAEDPPDGVSPR
jgi:hypothetical protein